MIKANELTERRNAPRRWMGMVISWILYCFSALFLVLWCDWANTLVAAYNLLALAFIIFLLDITVGEFVCGAACYGFFAVYLGQDKKRPLRRCCLRVLYLTERFRYFRNISSFPFVRPAIDKNQVPKPLRH